jgi:hypothetical protein
MNIKNVLALSVSIAIADLMLLASNAHAELPFVYTDVSVQTVHPAQSTAPSKVVAEHRGLLRRHKKEKATEPSTSEVVDASMDLPSSSGKAPLQGSATYVDLSGRFSDAVQRLTKSALDREPEYAKVSQAVDHYRTKIQRTVRFTKDAVNYAYPYRGFSMSMEGSRVILDKNQKINNLWIAELAKQRYWDEMHPKIMSQVMQISMGLGIEPSEQSDNAVRKGVEGLEKLVGKETADSTLAELSEWKNQLNVPELVFQQEPWDVDMTERIYQNALKTSADGDPVVRHIFSRVKKYDHGKIANCTASVVEANLAALTVLSGSPFISLASEGASTAFVMTTGGPEENKILQEIYYGRRLEIRRKRISDETNLALTNYEKGLLTHNKPQLAMSEIVLANLVGPEKIPELLERDPVNNFALTAPIELAKKGN